MAADLSSEAHDLIDKLGAAYRQAQSLGITGEQFVVHPYWDGLHNDHRLMLPDGCEPREIQTVKPALEELWDRGLLARVEADKSASVLTSRGLSTIGV